jgi:tetratricopeptide (TPR) repeat protein
MAANSRLAGLSQIGVVQVTSAMALLQQRNAAEAERTLHAALVANRDHPEILRLLGMTARLQGRDDTALAFLRRAAAHRPDDPLVQNGLATALEASGDHDAALDAFRRSCELAPHVAQLWANYGKALSDRARFDAAIPVLERAIALAPHDASQLRLAYALRVLGRTDEAARRYRELIARNPADAEAWLGLSNLKTRALSAEDRAALRALWSNASLRIDDRIATGFALAAALDQAGDYAGSFAVLRRANELTRSIRPWNAREFSGHVDRVIEACGDTACSADTSLGANVVFIVSMPRSGSSLTEQILASHPDVDGAGELGDLFGIVRDESQRRGERFPAWVNAATPDDWQRLGRDYLQRTRAYQTRLLFTDKMPDNWLRMAAALAMLPAARVIDCRRDAVETCFSCYRTLFNAGAQAFSYDLDDLASYHRDYLRTTDRWQARFDTRWRRQSYEDLVADPQRQIAELLEFCGLRPDAACERFYETERAVRTASSSQVREPLRTDTARSAKYGDVLDPIRDALARHPC